MRRSVVTIPGCNIEKGKKNKCYKHGCENQPLKLYRESSIMCFMS